MLDRWTGSWVKPVTAKIARGLQRLRIGPNLVTVIGFLIGMTAIAALWQQKYYLALALILINRVFDGLDGALARIVGQTDAGGYLDITLDFLFYAGIGWGFALADPQANALAAATLIFSFVGTGSSFLAFAILAAKRQINSITYPQKSFYYLGGLTEGSETIVIFVLFCLFPSHFSLLAYIFAGLCWITIVSRIFGGYYTLRQLDKSDQ